MTKVRLDSGIGGGPAATLEPLVPAIYGKPGGRWVGVVELHHTERTQPAPDSEAEPAVKLRISALEIAGREQEGAIREAMRALYAQRTASGTLDEYGELVLTEQTLKLCAGLLTEIETARLRAGLRHWRDYIRRVTTLTGITHAEVLHELQAVADGLASLLDHAGDDPT